MVDGDFGSLLDVVRYEYVYEVGGGEGACVFCHMLWFARVSSIAFL